MGAAPKAQIKIINSVALLLPLLWLKPTALGTSPSPQPLSRKGRGALRAAIAGLFHLRCCQVTSLAGVTSIECLLWLPASLKNSKLSLLPYTGEGAP
jgi:hypothetical protein